MSYLKKVLASAATVALYVALCNSFTYADGAGTGVVHASSLNVRTGPGTNYRVIDGLPYGETVTIISSSTNWLKVQTSSGETGWVYSGYIQAADTQTSRGGDVQRSSDGDGTQTQQLVDYSKRFLGVRYIYGGSSPNGFDCSGFVQYVYAHFGIDLNRVAADQATQGVRVAKSDLQPGDLVFFDTNGGHDYINHVGMYIGNGQFIQASSGRSAHKVVISNLTEGFYAETYMTARRVIN